MTRAAVVLVTGASGGLGEAVARCLGWAGASVGLMARRRERLEKTAEAVGELGGRVRVVGGSVADPEACRRAVAETIEAFGPIDALVNNAGLIDPLATIAEAREAEWLQSLAVNLVGPVGLTRWALETLRKRRGAVINVSSGAASHPIFGAGAYCAAKAALNHFTQVLALEEPEVAAIAVRPGMVDTPMQDRLRDRGADIMPPEHSAVYRDAKASGSLEPPGRPARTIAWLALHPPHAHSGAFLNWNDPRIADPAQTFFRSCPV